LTKETEEAVMEELEKAQEQVASTEECQCEEQEQELNEEEQEKAETQELKEQVAQLQEQLLRNAAELENFKRRINEERMKETKYRAQSLIANIIPAIDNFERALATTVEDEATTTFLTGFKMIHTQLVEALTKEGVEVIETDGVLFDPTVHQAVMQEAVNDVESGIVLEELQKGYKLKDRVIRPAMVKVSE